MKKNGGENENVLNTFYNIISLIGMKSQTFYMIMELVLKNKYILYSIFYIILIFFKCKIQKTLKFLGFKVVFNF